MFKSPADLRGLSSKKPEKVEIQAKLHFFADAAPLSILIELPLDEIRISKSPGSP